MFSENADGTGAKFTATCARLAQRKRRAAQVQAAHVGANLANDLPDGVVDTLLKVVHDNAPVFQRYFRAKARMIGVESCGAMTCMPR